MTSFSSFLNPFDSFDLVNLSWSDSSVLAKRRVNTPVRRGVTPGEHPGVGECWGAGEHGHSPAGPAGVLHRQGSR